MKNKLKYLLNNTIIFAIGNFASKFISFFLVPLYTNILTVAEYGTIDLIYTVCILIIPILTLNISEAVMRFTLDKNKNEDDIIKINNTITFFSVFIACIIIIPLSFIDNLSKYSIYVLLYLVTNICSQNYLILLKGQEKLKLYTFCNVLNTLLVAVFNVIFLVFFKFGIKGYLLAYTISNFIIFVFSFILSKSYKQRVGINNRLLFDKMIKYSIVLIPNTFMWWIMNSSDRIMVTSLMDYTANGIYAISYKIPTLISTVVSIFNQAWLFSAIREKQSKEEEAYTNLVFKYLFDICIIFGLFLFCFSKEFMKIYVSNNFYVAWKYMSFLIIGLIFQTLATFLSTSYNVYKNNKGFLFSGICGAILNIILNFILIPIFGIYGAALATCVSYISVFLYRLIDTRKYIKINFWTIRFMAPLTLLIISAFTMYIENITGKILLALELMAGIVLFYKEFYILFNKILKKRGN